MNHDPALHNSLNALTEHLGDLHCRALETYLPVVEQIISSGSRDVGPIEQTLDGLLDFAGHDEILPIYRRLCRHYFDIDPVAAVVYVHAYREMYDSAFDAASEAKE